MAKDVVCGMDVDERNPSAKSEYQGKAYYFCSEYCKTAFDREPEKYLAAPGTAGMPGTGAGLKNDGRAAGAANAGASEPAGGAAGKPAEPAGGGRKSPGVR